MFYKTLIIILSFVIVACEKTKEPTVIGPSEVKTDVHLLTVQELDNLIHPLSGASPELNHDDMLPLAYLGNSKIVGLGEATHGTKEFFQLKHRIFKYLVENHGFKIFGFEADMGESIFIDRYITTGKGNIKNLMLNKMHFWTWKTEEVKDLLEWMKIYNEGKTEDEKIHYMGIDCQYMTYQPYLILEYFNKVKPEFISEINPTLNMIKAMRNNVPSRVREYYENMSATKKQEISDSLGNVLTKINDIESELIAKSSHFEYLYIRQLVRNMQQVNEKLFTSTRTEYSYRDKYMAENAIWLSTLFGENTKIAIWAHNGHVSYDTSYDYDGSMGYHLKSEIGTQYQIVGFSFSKGSFSAAYRGTRIPRVWEINTDPHKFSLNHIFFKAKYDNFILKIADIPTHSESGSLISTLADFLSIGAWYDSAIRNPPCQYISLRDCFDVLINYDITTAAVQLSY